MNIKYKVQAPIADGPLDLGRIVDAVLLKYSTEDQRWHAEPLKPNAFPNTAAEMNAAIGGSSTAGWSFVMAGSESFAPDPQPERRMLVDDPSEQAEDLRNVVHDWYLHDWYLGVAPTAVRAGEYTYLTITGTVSGGPPVAMMYGHSGKNYRRRFQVDAKRKHAGATQQCECCGAVKVDVITYTIGSAGKQLRTCGSCWREIDQKRFLASTDKSLEMVDVDVNVDENGNT